MSISFVRRLRPLETPGTELPGRGFNRAAPLSKVVVTVGFLILAVSLNRYDWRGAAVFAAIPFLTAAWGGVPVFSLWKRTLRALPFVLCAGVANCFFDRNEIWLWPGVSLSGGIVTAAVLVFKTFGTVGAVLYLAATTPMNEIAGALTRLRVPCVLVLQLQLSVRYLGVLTEEARNMAAARALRAPGRRKIPVREWGTLAGHLFLRSVERANGVSRSMSCRLFHAGHIPACCREATAAEWFGAAAILMTLGALRAAL